MRKVYHHSHTVHLGNNLPAKDTETAMFGFAGLPVITGETVYYLRSFAGVLLLSLVGATPLMKTLAARMPGKLVRVLEPVVLVGLLIVCTAYLVDGSFNPFLYFRF